MKKILLYIFPSLFLLIFSQAQEATIKIKVQDGVNLSWQSVSENSYQPQISLNSGTTWSDIGAAITGNGLVQSYYGLRLSDSQRYRVLEQTTGADVSLSVITNGGFESGTGAVPSNWATNNSSRMIRSDEKFRTGSYSMHSTVVNDGNTPSNNQLTQSITAAGGSIVAGKSYDLSFWVNEIRSGVSYVQQYQIQWLNSSG